ncbi:MAG: hypothetical protein NXH75_01530 [Halobacteriovoraceae bacterium]|nr:hypothetical protein [Halobacteriovoraceae bacterium]
MSKKNPETEEFYRKLMQATNAVGAPHFGKQEEERVRVNIRPDKSISPGMFKPDPLNLGHFKAHPTTIEAMRKDIFVGGSDEFVDLEQSYICEGCKRDLDVQFWLFCPYCEAEFPKELKIL